MHDAPSLISLQQRIAQQWPDHPAIAFNGATTTFAEFAAQSDRGAAFLQQRGIRRGDRVGLYCINSDAFAAAYFAIVKAGGTVVPLNLLLTPPELVYILRDSGARGLLYYEGFEPAVAAMRPQLPDVEFAVHLGLEPTSRGGAEFSRADLFDCPAPWIPPAIDPANDVAVLIYTSGTTGHPKGAMLTHRNLCANATAVREAMRLEPGRDVLLVVLPMFHAFAGTVGLLFPLLHGCTIVPLPRFDPGAVLDAIEASQATIFFAVPSMFNILLRMQNADVGKFRSVRFAVSGGAAMPAEVMRQFEEKYGTLIYEGDGPTECGPVTCVNPIGGRRKPGSVGREAPSVEMRIMDAAGREVPVGEAGEICVRGPSVMKGYWNRPEETAASFFGEWFRTGDIGVMDEDRYFFILDRIKDMVIVNGMNVYPRAVEEVLYQHPAVAEAAVVGEPSELHGEVPIAFVVLHPGAEADDKALRSFCRERLGRHEIPRQFHLRESLPKNAAGKILKRELRRSGEVERGVDRRS